MPRKKPDNYQRVRGSKACASCSRRKTKCNGELPCSVCQAKSLECAYLKGKKRGPPSKQKQRQLDDQGNSSSPSAGRSETTASHNGQHFTPLTWTLDELASIADQSQNDNPMQDASASAELSVSASAHSDHGSSSKYTSISDREIQSLFMVPSSSIVSQASVDSAQLDDSIRQHRRSSTFNHLGDESPISELSKQVIDQLLTVYQYFVHLHWPIIYLPSLSSLHVLADSHPLLYHAVLAVAAGTQDNEGPKTSTSPAFSSPLSSSSRIREPVVCPPGTAAKLVRYLQERVETQNLARTLETIQVLILLALVEMGSGDSSNAYIHASTACALAIDLGLHREQSAQPTMSYRPEQRKRVLWGCYILDKTLAAALERPMMLRSDDIDIGLPSTDERDEYDIFVNDRSRRFIAPDRVSAMTDVKCRCISTFRSSCELMVLLEKILIAVYSPKARRDRNGGQRDRYRQSVVRLDAGLRSWRRDLSTHLQWHSDSSDLLAPTVPDRKATQASTANGSSVTKKASQTKTGIPTQIDEPPQVLTMRAWYAACMLLLHRPRMPFNRTSASRPLSPIPVSNFSADTSLPVSVQSPAQGGQGSQYDKDSDSQSNSPPNKEAVLAIPGPKLVRAAATEICSLLPKYQATFSVRRIPSSWVYLVFQSAIIHSSFIESASTHHADDISKNESEKLFRQCIRSLEQISVTWRGASHHVATLRRVAESCRITRPSSPVPAAAPPAGSSQPFANITDLSVLPPAAGSDNLPSNGSMGIHRELSATDNSTAGLDWLDFWSQMPSSSEDVWVWQQFMDSFGSTLT